MHLADTSDQILHYLKHHDGKLELNDNSSPEAIYQTLQMSKKAFKKSVGILYRQRMIRLENDAIYLNT
ncbi:MAG TPA: RNA-binding protein, partial [Chitinophagaceae bacterium]|nr:RNA-binding protein [Chitinophagaceae bacterium]